MTELEIAGHTVTLETADPDDVALITGLLEAAVRKNGPCILTTTCNPEAYLDVALEGRTVRVRLEA